MKASFRNVGSILLIGIGLSACAGQPGSYHTPYGQRVSCGTGSNALIGGAAGALGGGALGNMAGKRDDRNARTIGGAAVGGLVGALVGSAFDQPCPQPTRNYYRPSAYDRSQEDAIITQKLNRGRGYY